MFKKNRKGDLNRPNTLIGEGIYLEAVRMTGQESVHIDGVYKGSIEIDSDLCLGDTGSITGDVSANNFLIAGEMNGNIECHVKLHLGPNAKVIGDVVAKSIIVDEGSQVSGRYRIGEPKPQQEIVEAKATDDEEQPTYEDGKKKNGRK